MAAKNKEMTSIILFLVRHAPTDSTGVILPGRLPGLSLSKNGHALAQQTADELAKTFNKSLSLNAIYSSPLLRARQTASYLSAKTSKKIMISSYLNECDFGEMTGKKLADLAKEKDWQKLHTWPSAWRFPNGETFWEVRSRMLSFLDEVRSKKIPGAVVAFSHADPIKILLSEIIGTSLDNFQRIQINPASVSILELPIDLGKPKVITINSMGDFQLVLEPIINSEKRF
jgi:broad specificity phosphatase PhoE